MDISELRREYRRDALHEERVAADPFSQFQRWLQDAYDAKALEPNAMTLATADADGTPHARIVLLKGFDETGLVFYTNYASQKGQQLELNPRAAVVFWWQELERQVRVEGGIDKTSREQSAAYFNSRPYASRLGASASRQSRVVADRETLERRFQDLQRQYPETVPLPADWGGYRLFPTLFEFWQGRSSRLHDRLRYRRQVDHWRIERLEP